MRASEQMLLSPINAAIAHYIRIIIDIIHPLRQTTDREKDKTDESAQEHGQLAVAQRCARRKKKKQCLKPKAATKATNR